MFFILFLGLFQCEPLAAPLGYQKYCLLFSFAMPPSLFLFCFQHFLQAHLAYSLPQSQHQLCRQGVLLLLLGRGMVLETRIWALGLPKFYAQQILVLPLPVVEVRHVWYRTSHCTSSPVAALALADEPRSLELTGQKSAQPAKSADSVSSAQVKLCAVVGAVRTFPRGSQPSRIQRCRNPGQRKDSAI